MANPNPKPPKKKGRRFCKNNRKGRRNDRKTSETFPYRDEVAAIDQPPPSAVAAAAAVPEDVDAPTVPSKRKLTNNADLTNSLAYSRRDVKRLRRHNARLIAECDKKDKS